MHLSQLPIFALTCECSNEAPRREHVLSEWKRLNIQGEFVEPILGIPKNKSGASGFFRMIERGLQLQKRDEPFHPFLMIEDDISFQAEGDPSLDIPLDADILYIGLSNCSMNDYCFHHANYYTSVEGFPEIVRIKHMLASHGIMVCSALGAAVLQRTMLEVFLCDKPWDVPLAFIQPYYNVYALRKPWVYQDAQFNGDEACTRITLEGDDQPLPENWNNRDWATIRMGERK